MTLDAHNRVRRGGPFEYDDQLEDWLNTLPGVLVAVLPNGGGYYRAVTMSLAVLRALSGGPIDLDRELSADDAAALVGQLSDTERDRLRDALVDVVNAALVDQLEENAAALEATTGPSGPHNDPLLDILEGGPIAPGGLPATVDLEPPPAPALAQCGAVWRDYRCTLEQGHSVGHQYGEPTPDRQAATDDLVYGPERPSERAMRLGDEAAGETPDPEFWGRK